jgi:hypothetical protein
MEFLSAAAEIIRDLLIFVVAMTALLIVLIVVVSRMPDDNPLKRILSALSYRIGATAAAGAVAIPVEPIPGLDGIYDIAVPIVLIWYWYTFFRDVFRARSHPQPNAPQPNAPQPNAPQPNVPQANPAQPHSPQLQRPQKQIAHD